MGQKQINHSNTTSQRAVVIILGLLLTLAVVCAIATPIFLPYVRWMLGDCAEWRQPHEIISNTLPLAVKWKYETEDSMPFQPHIADGIVFIKTSSSSCSLSRSSKSKLIALDAASGKNLWETDFTGMLDDIAPVVLRGTAAITVDAEQSVRGLDKDTGQFLWEFKLDKYDGPILGLASDEQNIFVAAGIDDQSVYALDPQSGAVLWTQNKFPSRSIMNILVNNGRLVALLHKNIFLLDLQTGNIISQYDADLSTVQSRFAHDENTIFLNPLEGISAVDLKTGETKWLFTPDCIQDKSKNEGPARSGRYFLFPPTPIGDSVYTTGGCRVVFALDKETGSPKWAYDNMGLSSISQVAPMNGLGYVMFSDWSIRAIDLLTGQEKGRLETHTEKPANWAAGMQGFATSKDMLYFSMGDRTVYALGQ